MYDDPLIPDWHRENWELEEEPKDPINEALSDAQRHAFLSSDPQAEQVRAEAEEDVKEEVSRLQEKGQYRRSWRLASAFVRLRENAVETDDYRAGDGGPPLDA